MPRRNFPWMSEPHGSDHQILTMLCAGPAALPEPWRTIRREVLIVFSRRRSHRARIDALLEVNGLLRRSPSSLIDLLRPVVTQEFRKLASELHSLRVHEQLVLSQFEQLGYTWAEHLDPAWQVQLPSFQSHKLEASAKHDLGWARSGVTTTLREALAMLVDWMADDFVDLSLSEAEAGQRLLQYLFFAPRIESRSWMTAADRLHLFEHVGLELWSALDRHVHQLDPGVADQSRLRKLVHMQLRSLCASEPAERAAAALPSVTGPGPGQHTILKAPIPPSVDRYDVQALKRYERLLQPMPVARLPSRQRIDEIGACLQAEFPWASEAVDAVMSDLRTRSLFGSLELGVSPMLLVGPPGCGKSRLARRLAEELQLRFRSISCGGTGDVKLLLGTSRGWASGQASPIIDLLLEEQCASALVLLDEIDKAEDLGDAGGRVRSAALGLLEPENARNWYDGFLQAPCDLSKVVFVATANGLSELPKPLMSRMQLLYVPSPGVQHVEGIVQGATRDIARDMGLPADALPVLPLDVQCSRAMSAREIKAMLRSQLHAWALENLGPERLH
jgi:hypothetical protein